MNSAERHFTRYHRDRDPDDPSKGKDGIVFYTCDEEGDEGPLYNEHFQPVGFSGDEPVPPPTGPVTLSYRRGEGLQPSWAIIKKGGVTFAEEPISHDLCDALLARTRLTDAAPALLAACVSVVRHLAVEVPLGNSTIGQCLDAIYDATGEDMTDEDFLDVAARGMGADNG